jgi:RNA polymerase sigma-70 factor (ECF subfamily)
LTDARHHGDPKPDRDDAAHATPDRDALARAMLDHLDSLYRLALSFAGNTAEAEDLLQDTLARAIAAESQFERGTNLRAWLCRILRNAFIDRRRRDKRDPVRLELESADDERLAYDKDDPLRGDAELTLLRRVVAADIERALSCLSVDARTVILLDLEGFTESELAVALGCAVGTIKSRLSRARALLRAELVDYGR